jgi:class 3 adenylate cyclase/tetratricopeptide (TPR) repeat protein
VADAAIPVSEGPPDGVAPVERRLVSVLFADLVGFTSLSEGRDPEDVRELLSRYFEVCRDLVVRYGGELEKFIGDAVMAVWGAPVANEDDAERAVRTALGLVESVAALGTELGIEGLSAGAGVLTGEAAVYLAKPGQGMVAGDLVNTASRAQSVAEPGTVLVGEATRRAAEAAIAFVEAGAYRLKGKEELVPLWRALRVVSGRGGAMRAERLEAPFVGRDRELRLVKELFHTATETSRAQLVQVSGVAGVGKSRLAWEFFKYLDGLPTSYLWHQGRCLAYGETVSYWALAEMVRGRAGITEGEEQDAAAVKLAATVADYVPDNADRRFVEPRLAQLIGLGEAAGGERPELFAAWRLFIASLARRAPVVMVFEDMQWADASLVEFLGWLLERSRDLPLFVMSLARPLPSMTAVSELSARDSVSLRLEPVPDDDMERLLAGLVPGLPSELVARILIRAEGVPLYAVEIVRMLLDKGRLVADGPTYRPVGDVSTLEVPESLHALIASRLDALPAEDRRLVQQASVLGKTFTTEALAAVSGLSVERLEVLVADLVALEVLAVQDDPRSAERGQAGFLQDLVRSVAYGTLSRADRRRLHLAAAGHLEADAGAEGAGVPEVAASHLLEAYRLDESAPDATAVRDRSRAMLARAGERAASLGARPEAQRYFTQAAELAEPANERADLLLRAGEQASSLGHLDEAAALYGQAVALAKGAGQDSLSAQGEAGLALVDGQRGQVEQSIERLRAAQATLRGAEPDAVLAKVTATLAGMLVYAGRHLEAFVAAEEALELAEQLDLPEAFCLALNARAGALIFGGRLGEAAALLRAAIDTAVEHDLTSHAAHYYGSLGAALEGLDRWDEALALEQRRLELARRTGSRRLELGSLVGRLSLLYRSGRWDEALIAGAEAMAMEELRSNPDLALQTAWLVPVHLGQGDTDKAATLLGNLSGDAEANQHAALRAMYFGKRAELLMAEGQPGEALAVTELGMALRPELRLTDPSLKQLLVTAAEASLALGDLDHCDQLLDIVSAARPGEVTPWLRAQSARLSARLAGRRGRNDNVEASLVAAEDGLRGIGAVFDLAVTQLEHAEWWIGQAKPKQVPPFLDEAAATFARLNARPWRERLDQARANSEPS